MQLSEKIKYICQSITDQDFYNFIILQNDGDERGDYIAAWDHPTIARPTDEQLAAIA